MSAPQNAKLPTAAANPRQLTPDLGVAMPPQVSPGPPGGAEHHQGQDPKRVALSPVPGKVGALSELEQADYCACRGVIETALDTFAQVGKWASPWHESAMLAFIPFSG
jgi:hypothetical protein